MAGALKSFTFNTLISPWEQIPSVMAYYWDHKNTLDRELAQALREADERRAAAGPSAFSRLRSQGCP